AGGSRSVVEGGVQRMPRLTMLIVTLTGAALLALHVALIGCFIRRRAATRNASASSSTKNVTLDVYGLTPASTPGATHTDPLLSLTSMSPHHPSNTPPPYQVDHQTNVDHVDHVDRCDPPSLVIPNAAAHPTPMSIPAHSAAHTTPTPIRPPTHPTPRQNGMVVVSRDTTTLYVSSALSPQNTGRLAP
ncbi:hypothetical protein OTU49_009912, partial [Cherax quadricarinatus]